MLNSIDKMLFKNLYFKFIDLKWIDVMSYCFGGYESFDISSEYMLYLYDIFSVVRKIQLKRPEAADCLGKTGKYL